MKSDPQAFDLSLDYIIQTYLTIRPVLDKACDDMEAALAIYGRKKSVQNDSGPLRARLAATRAFLAAMDTIKESPSQIPRGDVIQGATYTVKPPTEDFPYFVTINDMLLNGRRRPIEVFINTKNPQAHQWISAFTRLLSAQLQQPGPFPAWIVRELKEVYDLTGGYFIKGGTVPSVVSHVGRVLEAHCKNLGIRIDEKKESGNE